MARKIPERENKSKNAKDNAASANSVPALRAEVVRLAEAVERIETLLGLARPTSGGAGS